MRITTVTLMSMALVWMASGQIPSDTIVNEPRPMMAMADYLQQQFGVAINYEDPPFGYKDDIRDITDQVQSPRQREANPNVRILVPRGGALSVPPVSVRYGQPADAAVALERTKSAHEAASFPGKFKISQTALAVFVEPQQVRRPSGEWNNASSALSVPISFPRERRTAADTLSLIIASAVQSGGTKIDIAAVPMVAFANIEVELGVSAQPARAALVSLFEQMSARLVPDGRQRTLFSYRLLFDPGLRYYMLSVVTVPNKEVNTPEKQLKNEQVGSFGRVTK